LIRYVQTRPREGEDSERVTANIRLALFALARYFPAPPAPQEPADEVYVFAFRSYSTLLHEMMSRAPHAAYAVEALLRLQVLSVRDDPVKSAFQEFPSSIRGAINYFSHLRNSSQ